MDFIKTEWASFEAWLNTWFPGFKTKALLILGTIGNGAAMLQQFITGLPVTKYITTETLAGASMILYLLAFWFQNLGDRVEARKDAE